MNAFDVFVMKTGLYTQFSVLSAAVVLLIGACGDKKKSDSSSKEEQLADGFEGKMVSGKLGKAMGQFCVNFTSKPGECEVFYKSASDEETRQNASCKIDASGKYFGLQCSSGTGVCEGDGTKATKGVVINLNTETEYSAGQTSFKDKSIDERFAEVADGKCTSSAGSGAAASSNSTACAASLNLVSQSTCDKGNIKLSTECLFKTFDVQVNEADGDTYCVSSGSALTGRKVLKNKGKTTEKELTNIGVVISNSSVSPLIVKLDGASKTFNFAAAPAVTATIWTDKSKAKLSFVDAGTCAGTTSTVAPVASDAPPTTAPAASPAAGTAATPTASAPANCTPAASTPASGGSGTTGGTTGGAGSVTDAINSMSPARVECNKACGAKFNSNTQKAQWTECIQPCKLL